MSKSKAIIADVKPVVSAEMPIDTRAYFPASSGFLNQTKHCKMQPGMLSAPSYKTKSRLDM